MLQSQVYPSFEGEDEGESEMYSEVQDDTEGAEGQLPPLGPGVEFQQQYDVINNPVTSPTPTYRSPRGGMPPSEAALTTTGQSPRLNIPPLDIKARRNPSGLPTSGRQGATSLRAHARFAASKQTRSTLQLPRAHDSRSPRALHDHTLAAPTDPHQAAHAGLHKSARDFNMVKGSYGKWYMRPKDFNQSLLNRMNILQQEAANKHEVREERRLQENANFFLENYKLLDQAAKENGDANN